MDDARGSKDGLDVEDAMKADEARLPPIRRGALNMMPQLLSGFGYSLGMGWVDVWSDDKR